MSSLKPWAEGPFELILHAEVHRLAGDDIDRRIAFIILAIAAAALLCWLQLVLAKRESKALPRPAERRTRGAPVVPGKPTPELCADAGRLLGP